MILTQNTILSVFRSVFFFGRFLNFIICFRDLLTFSSPWRRSYLAGTQQGEGQGGHLPPQILADQLTLSQPGGGADYAHHSTTCPPGFLTLAASLLRGIWIEIPLVVLCVSSYGTTFVKDILNVCTYWAEIFMNYLVLFFFFVQGYKYICSYSINVRIYLLRTYFFMMFDAH